MAHLTLAGAPAPTRADLCRALTDVDALAADHLSEIRAVADLALQCLKLPGGSKHLDSIARALRAIRDRATEARNDINFQAETVGCNAATADRENCHA